MRLKRDYIPAILLVPLYFVHSTAFNFPFLEIKLIYWIVLCFLAGLLLLMKSTWSIPSGWGAVAFGALTTGAIISILKTNDAHQWLWSAYTMSGLLMLVFVMQLTEGQRQAIENSVIMAALAQSLFVFGLILIPNTIYENALFFDEKAVAGFVGNSEFFATLLGVALLLIMQTYKFNNKNVITIGILLFALTLTKSKGTIGLLGFILAFRFLPKILAAVTGCSLAIGASIYFYINDFSGVYGRILTWIVSFDIGLENFPLGAGAGQLQRNYFKHIELLFQNSVFLKSQFGTHSSMPIDPHNLPLHLWLDYGIFGLVTLSAVSVVLWEKKYEIDEYSESRWLLLVKSLYTVVLGAVTSLSLVILIFSRGIKKKNIQVQVREKIILGVMMSSLVVSIPRIISSYNYEAGYKNLLNAKYDRALAYFNKAIAWDSNYADAYLGSGLAQFRKNNNKESRVALLKAVSSETQIDTLKQSAAILFHSGYLEESNKLNLRLLVVYPENLVAMTRLAQAYVLLKTPDKALEYSYNIINVSPRIKNIRDHRFRRIAQEILDSEGTGFNTW